MDRRELKDLAFVVAGLGSQLTGVDSDSNTVYTYQKGEECESSYSQESLTCKLG
jgi:hypothetical protein